MSFKPYTFTPIYIIWKHFQDHEKRKGDKNWREEIWLFWEQLQVWMFTLLRCLVAIDLACSHTQNQNYITVSGVGGFTCFQVDQVWGGCGRGRRKVVQASCGHLVLALTLWTPVFLASRHCYAGHGRLHFGSGYMWVEPAITQYWKKGDGYCAVVVKSPMYVCAGGGIYWNRLFHMVVSWASLAQG